MNKDEFAHLQEWVQRYLNPVYEEPLIPALIGYVDSFIELLKNIPESKGEYAYAEGKWTIKEVAGHVIDCERILAFRALHIARKDTTSLPGFDQDAYVANANANSRKLYEMVNEMAHLRASTIDLFSSLSDEMLQQKGSANGLVISAEMVGYYIAGHALHHEKILRERYL